jgi:hypothetical protein
LFNNFSLSLNIFWSIEWSPCKFNEYFQSIFPSRFRDTDVVDGVVVARICIKGAAHACYACRNIYIPVWKGGGAAKREVFAPVVDACLSHSHVIGAPRHHAELERDRGKEFRKFVQVHRNTLESL